MATLTLTRTLTQTQTINVDGVTDMRTLTQVLNAVDWTSTPAEATELVGTIDGERVFRGVLTPTN
jgi:hypothetical protein